MRHLVQSIAVTIRDIPRSVILLTLATLTSVGASASTLAVAVQDRAGAPVKDVVVIARLIGGAERPATETPPAVMDQLNRQFAPYIIAVHTGSAVMFANSDSVAHQIYSFSPPRPFELGLYRGKPRNPIVFDKPGVVVLGCNIHDNMIGYVYVTDAPYFGTTDSAGHLQFSALPAGNYSVEIWTPRSSAKENVAPRSVSVASEQSLNVDFKFQFALEPEPAAVREPRLRDY